MKGRWFALALILTLTACGGPPDSPETEIQSFVAKVQTAAEERNARELRSLVAEDYVDAQGHDHKAIERLIRLHVFRNQSIHIFTRIQTIEFPEPERALVIVMAALAGRPVASADQLAGLNANLYRFNLELIRQGRDDWLVKHAAWERAQLTDFW
jgi:hypothetical protein